ncbi:MAG: hypothetical protein A3F74_08435 [Betaproteobacteria bacterium RIFCSPLOWO2_12_FULL_62_58]|nr:MAG: hypothetical protein A3F74_08435 [Betaproteobacteria bacterium RIFCSPLOWO2_12_FULL_62_58]
MEQPGNLPNAEYRRFEGMREYEAVIDSLIPQTQSVIRVFDKSLSRAYNSPQRFELLRQFLLASRLNRLLIVLHEVDTLERVCPRMLLLLQQFSYAVSIRETLRPAKHVYDPFVIFDASHYVHRFHYDHLRAAQGTNDVLGAQQLIDRFDEIREASGPAVSANVSGL